MNFYTDSEKNDILYCFQTQYGWCLLKTIELNNSWIFVEHITKRSIKRAEEKLFTNCCWDPLINCFGSVLMGCQLSELSLLLVSLTQTPVKGNELVSGKFLQKGGIYLTPVGDVVFKSSQIHLPPTRLDISASHAWPSMNSDDRSNPDNKHLFTNDQWPISVHMETLRR